MGWTPLTFAVHCDELKIIEFLITYGGSSDPNYYDDNQWTPLHRVIADERLDAAKCLIKHGADINLIDGFGMTPLTTAIKKNNIKMLKFFIVNGENLLKCTGGGSFPLSIAVKENHLDMVKVLVGYVASMNIGDQNGGTPFLGMLRV